MARADRRDELGRGERVLPGLWRLRLPLPWPVVPHVNAWALADGDGLVLVDCGMDGDGGLSRLEHALAQVGLRLELVHRVVLTHAHVDHCGLAGAVVERTGCALWVHPRREHSSAGAALPPAQDLLEGTRIGSDHGEWEVVETPGHAPSHVVLHQPERRLLLSGDHVLGRVSLYFDHGWTPDPIAETLASLDRMEGLDVRLTLSGHGRPFTDLRGHVSATRALVEQRLAAVLAALGDGEAAAPDLLVPVYGRWATPDTTGWLLGKLACYLEHLERRGTVTRSAGAPERWRRS